MTRRREMIGVLMIVATILAGACAPRTVGLYSLDTVEASLELHYKDGEAWIGEQAAPSCQGEHRTVSEDEFGSYESAVLTCTDGRVIECNFEFSELIDRGTGMCVDNEQRRYRVLF